MDNEVSFYQHFLQGGMKTGAHEKLGVDESTLGDQFVSKIGALKALNPCHVVICTKNPTPEVYMTVQSFFEAGVAITLIWNRLDAPAKTQWLT